MQNPFSRLKHFLSKPTDGAPSAGLYHFRHHQLDEKSRIHLRIDADGSGVLIINANRVMHLNKTAAWMAMNHLEKKDSSTTIRSILRQYNTSANRLQADYDLIVSQVDELIRPNGACPVHEMMLENKMPFSARPSAPYRMDLAVTYRCNNDCLHCYNDRPRNYPEMETSDWKMILDKIWDLTIPHVVFTGGEPTLRTDLPELIAYAENLGLITGLNTNGRRISEPDYLKCLVDAGLDHVQITLESHDPAIHDKIVHANGAHRQTVLGIQNALRSPLYMMTNTTMLQPNSVELKNTLQFLADLGVPTIGLNSLIYSGKGASVGSGLREAELPALLDIAKEMTEKHGQTLIWYTPTEYCKFDPVTHEVGVKGCTAALYNMCIEPDGGVLPCQSYYLQLGNFLNDDWDSIWNHPISISLRERHNLPEKCTDCSLIAECGGGCPLHRTSEDTLEKSATMVMEG